MSSFVVYLSEASVNVLFFVILMSNVGLLAKESCEYFIIKLKKWSDPENRNLIFVENFEKVLNRFKINLPIEDKEKLIQSLPGLSEDGRYRINLSKLYDQKYTIAIKNLYQKVDFHDNEGGNDPVDQSGYTRQFYRPNQSNLGLMIEAELVKLFFNNNKMNDVMRIIS